MNTQILICCVIFVAMLVSFLIGKLSLGLIGALTAIALVVTGCATGADILSSIGSGNVVTVVCMIVLGAGLGRTSIPARITAVIRKITKGNYRLAYLGVLTIGLLLTSMLTSPMAAYSICFPIMDSVCDEFGVSRSKAQFPLLVVILSCAAILPLGASIGMATLFDGYMQTYGFTQGFTAMDSFKGRWPILFVVMAWAYFIAPKITIEKPVVPIEALEARKNNEAKPLSKFANVAGGIIFFLVVLGFIFNAKIGLPSWLVAFIGVIAMICCGTLSEKEAIRAIPVDISMLFVGANTMAIALVSTGTAKLIGDTISNAVGGVTNTFILHAVFFIVPFIITQFMQNQGVMNVFAPIALITCGTLGADPRGCLILITAGALTAYMTPSATAAVILCMGAGGYNIKSLFKMGWLLAVILCVVYVTFVSLVFPAF